MGAKGFGAGTLKRYLINSSENSNEELEKRLIFYCEKITNEQACFL
jgi:hypothetical protein